MTPPATPPVQELPLAQVLANPHLRRAAGWTTGLAIVGLLVFLLTLQTVSPRGVETLAGQIPQPLALVAEDVSIAGPVVEQLPFPRVEELTRVAVGPERLRAPRQVPAPRGAEALLMPAVEKEPFVRRNNASEAALRQQAMGAEEVGLGGLAGRVYTTYTDHVVRQAGVSGSKGDADCMPLWHLNPAFALLPMVDGGQSRISPKAANDMATLSRKLRLYLNNIAPQRPAGQGRELSVLREKLRGEMRSKKPEWLRVGAVPTINQMLMAEDHATRRLLVELLAAIPEKPATLALVQRVLFDFNPDVRAAAIEALIGRDPEVWQPELIKGFDYPWSPVADFAAEALINLGDRSAIPDLVVQLDKPRPGRPYLGPNRTMLIREVVKINHLSNCLLCHPPAVRGDEAVIGIDPFQTNPGVVITNSPLVQALAQSSASSGGHDYGGRAPTQASSGGPRGGGRGGPRGPGGVAVTGRNNLTATQIQLPVGIRGDITFLRQDFSVSYPIPAPALPNGQPNWLPNLLPAGLPPVRFDYVVRTRPVLPEEMRQWRKLDEQDNPQRAAVLFALRTLSKLDLDESTESWVKAFPLAKPEVRSVKLASRLARAEPLQQLGLLQSYRDNDGVEYLWALQRAIPRMKTNQEVARVALAAKLAREPNEVLRRHLADKDDEMRQAAVRAAGEKRDRDLIGDLMPLARGDGPTAKLAQETVSQLER